MQLCYGWAVQYMTGKSEIFRTCRFGFRGCQLVLLWTTMVVAACHAGGLSDDAKRKIAMAMVLDDADAPRTALMWVADRSDRYQTNLLNGNKNELIQLGNADDIILSWNDRALRISRQIEAQVLCDCAEWADADFEGDCPHALDTADYERLVLSELNVEESDAADEESKADIDLAPLPVIDEDLQKLTSLAQRATVAGIIGPYVFIRYENRHQLCNPDTAGAQHGYRIFSLETRQFESVLTDAEWAALNEGERAEAFETIRTATGFEHVSEDDVELVDIRPTFVYGLGFSLTYQFEAHSEMEESENNWRDYTRQVEVQARKIPERLTQWVLAPSLIRQLVPVDGVSVLGWSLITGKSEANHQVQSALLQTPKE